jgi:hypothetical protein
LKLKRCGYDVFPFVEHGVLDDYGITDYYCLDEEWKLRGNWYSEEFWYIELKLTTCSSETVGVTCASDSEIDNYLLGN